MTNQEKEHHTLVGLYGLVENNTKVLEELALKIKEVESRTLTVLEKEMIVEEMESKKWRAKSYDYIMTFLKNIVLVSGAVAAGAYLYEFFGGKK